MISNLPEHIAIVMDGNGRWGKQRGLTRSQGHYEGTKTMERTIKDALDIGIKVLTLYAFSTENWTRPEKEVQYLLDLPGKFLNEKLPEFLNNNIKVCFSGDIDQLPSHTKKAIKTAMDKTANNNALIVNFAMNYGGRNELVSAVRNMVGDIQKKTISLENISEELMETYLYTSGLPEPDIIIRTGGEKRLSNFLLWQASKAELWFTDIYFPDFNKEHLLRAVEEVNKRKKDVV
ncbi:undecaprenyl diphosphate synthase [Gracilibacillus ureilyticus]|uniref:Isoprenyl transferase n=1 Tax=Gracilibacillus ureilyticus TaxID=531814 RepID=A0A1H9QK00_9BACI|nr:isoprenyl transferase [Gracilibacillus ureilyticus]SER60760.1 undecaprenyl diphosphate synthase [Gracilibacillus ureilyticus]